MMFNLILVVLLSIVKVALALKCSNASTIFNGINATLVFETVTQLSSPGNLSIAPLTGSGQVVIVSAFTFAPPANATYTWYGFTPPSVLGVRLYAANLTASSGVDSTFSLDANPAYSFGEFTAIELFDVTNSIAVAKASLPSPKNATAPPPNTFTVNGTGTTQTSSPTATSAAVSLTTSAALLLVSAIALVFL